MSVTLRHVAPPNAPLTFSYVAGQVAVPPLPSIILQMFVRSTFTPPRETVLPPLNFAIGSPPGPLKYTFSAVASICALSIVLHVLVVLVQAAALMTLRT